MKKLFALFVVAIFIPLQAFAVEQWKEGEHFTVLDKPATEKPEIREYFSYWCYACYSFEPIFNQIMKQKPENVSVNKVHVNFMGFTSAEIQNEATKAMVIARANKQEDKLNAAIFDYIHKQRATVGGLKDLRNIFIVNGVEGEDFDKMASSFGVNSMARRNNKLIADYREVLSGVPNIIVNGKYQVNLGATRNPDDIIDLILWLTTI